MAKCVRCGREIPVGEIFCEICATKPLPDAGTSSASGRHLKKKKKQKAPASSKGGRVGLIIALVISILFTLAALALSFYIYETVSHERANLRAQQAELAQRESAALQAEKDLEEKLAELKDSEQTIAKLEREIRALQEQIRGSESQSSQSQYDLTAAREQIRELEEKQAEYEQALADLSEQMTNLQADYDILFADNETLQADYDALSEQKLAMEDKLSWIDAYVVYVENDGSNHYHTYECEKFVRKSFWIYNRKLAENKGYTACPICGG